MIKSPALEKIVAEVGLAACWKRDEKVQIAQNLIAMGLDCEKIVEATKLDLSTVESLYNTAQV